ncbi:MAG TPA: Lpg1974 family pore-forming outer membrane protein [Rhabdochlamydiaceae bacterium]
MKKFSFFFLCALSPVFLHADDEFEEDFEDCVDSLAFEEYDEVDEEDSREEDLAFRIKESALQAANDAMQDHNMPLSKEEIIYRDCWPPQDRHWIIEGEFLWWKVGNKYMDYAIYQDSIPPYNQWFSNSLGDAVSDFLGEFKKVDLDYSPGFRLNLGYVFPSTPWIVNGQYTAYHASDSSKIDKLDLGYAILSVQPQLYATRERYASFSTGFAESHISFDYNVANITFQRSIELGKKFTITPFFGPQGAWIQQKQKFHFISPTPPYTTLALDTLENERWALSAGGILTGIKLDCCLAYGFSLYSSTQVGGVYGNYKRKVLARTLPPLGPEQFSNLKDTLKFSTFNFAVQTGASWNRNFNGYALRVFAGWEFNLWTDLHSTFRSIPSGNGAPRSAHVPVIDNSDVFLQGLTLGAELRI